VSPFCVGVTKDPACIGAAYEAGINFFFVTADMHWPLYEATRQGLATLLRDVPRENVVVAAASYVTQPEFCREPFLELIDAIPGLKTIDLVIAGGAYAQDLLVRLEQYRRQRETGFVGAKAVGASFHDRRAAVLAINHALVDIAFLRYNPRHTGAAEEVFPHITNRETLVFNFKSSWGWLEPERYNDLGISAEYWRPKVTDYYRFALTRPEIHGVLCAPSSPAHIAEIAAALEEGGLDLESEEYLLHLADLIDGRAIVAP
jgi:predicted aldo/keto reductase-like oxidoreductase